MPPGAANNNNPLIGGGRGPGAASNTSSSWFVGAPITKLCALSTVILYLFLHAKTTQDTMGMDSYRMMRAVQYGKSEWYRYWSSKITFGTTGELVMGGMLLALIARRYEREMGSRKFGVFVLVVNACAILLEMSFLGLSTLFESGYYRYQGPYPLLGALMFLYHRFTPRLHPRFFGILGFTFSEKSFYYLWFMQVVGYSGYSTIIASSLGAITTYVYIATNLHESVDLPDAIAKPLSSIGSHISEPPPRVVAPIGAGGGNRGAGRDTVQRMMRNNAAGQAAAAAAAAAAQRPAAPAPPDPAAIEQLTSMGFERQRVVDALQATNNSVERAADRLLAG